MPSRCRSCAQHEARFPEATERAGDPDLPDAAARELLGVVDRRVADGESFEDALAAELVERCQARAAELVPKLLVRYGARMSEQYGVACLAAAVGEQDWVEVVGDALDDLLEDDNPPWRPPPSTGRCERLSAKRTVAGG